MDGPRLFKYFKYWVPVKKLYEYSVESKTTHIIITD